MAGASPGPEPLTVFTARSFLTMNPSLPRAEAVAVRGDRIVEVGTIDSLRPWLDANEHRFDDRFADRYVTPGFIDPHLHPTMAAVLLPMEFATAMRWKLPWGTVEPVTTPEAFVDRVRALDAERPDGAEPLFVWGYHQLWHGPMSRGLLDEINPERPICVWHRSYQYAREGIGYERASQMARLGSCFRAGITTTVHSDFTMAPAEPLNSAWVAVNRVNHAGDVMCPEERLSPEQALAAITINAAKVLGRADEIGSIRAGKKADFTVLAEDPLTVDPMRLRDIDVVATVFEGRVFPIDG